MYWWSGYGQGDPCRDTPWLSEEDVRKILERIFAELGGAIDVDDLRRELGVRPDELVEELEVYDVEELERREKERLLT